MAITAKEQFGAFARYMGRKPSSGIIQLARGSRTAFSSTSLKLTPCMMVAIETKGSPRVSVISPVGTSAGKREPSSLTKKGEFQAEEKKIFSKILEPALRGKFCDPINIDRILETINSRLPKRQDKIDTPFSRMGGANATATSFAALLCAANSAGVNPEIAIDSLYSRIAFSANLPQPTGMSLPIPMAKAADGGVHGALDKKDRPINPVQEYLWIPAGYTKWTEAVEASMEATARFRELMDRQHFDMSIGAEAGIVSKNLVSVMLTLQLMSDAIRGYGNKPPLPGMFIGLDVAASELYKNNKYFLGADGKKMFGNEYVDFGTLIGFYERLIEYFPSITSIEDGFSEDDRIGWKAAFNRLGHQVLLITDDATVTQPDLVKQFVTMGTGGLLTKVNQAGTFTRTCLSMAIAAKNNWMRILSHRSSEAANFVTEAQMAVALGAEFLKVTIGSTHGGGGGREGRPNWVSEANVSWEGMWEGMNKRHPDWAIYNDFWAGIPEKFRIPGLPYQGLKLQHAENVPAWLKRLQEKMTLRAKGVVTAYDFNNDPWYLG